MKLDLYPPNFQAELQADWAIFHGIIAPDANKFQEILQAMDEKKPSFSKVTLNSFEAALAMQKRDIESAQKFATKVLNTKELKGTTKLYQQLMEQYIFLKKN